MRYGTPVSWLRIIALGATVAAATRMALFRPRHMTDGWAWNALLNALHHPVAAVVLLAIAGALPRRWTPGRRAAVAAGAVSIAATGVELVQPYVGREASLSDLWIGLAGVASGVAIVLAANSQRRLVWAGAATLTLASLLVVSLPAIHDWSVVAARDRALPTLFDPMEPWAMSVWLATGEDSRAEVSPDRSPRAPAWRVEMDGPWEGLELLAGQQNWDDYDTLHIALTNPGGPFELEVRVDHRIPDGGRNRSSHNLQIAPGGNDLQLPLAAVRSGGYHGALDTCCIDQVYLTRPSTEPDSTLLLEKIWLE